MSHERARLHLDRERLAVWGTMLVMVVIGTLVTMGVLNRFQDQRRHMLLVTCKRQNAKHHRLFSELREQRAVDVRLRGQARVSALHNDAQREALVNTLEPWEDCSAKVRLFVH